MSGVSSIVPEEYGALSDAQISDIASNEGAAKILRRLRDNDPDLSQLFVSNKRMVAKYDGDDFDTHSAQEACALEARDMGVLGYYLGRCTNVTVLRLELSQEANMGTIAPFLAGLQSNKSICWVQILGWHPPRDFLRMLTPFVKGNPSLAKFNAQQCRMDADQYHALSLALREGKSLKHLVIGDLGGLIGDLVNGGRYEHEQSIIDNIEALKMHPQLERIALYGFAMGRNICAALSELLQHSAFGVRHLILDDNGIDDSGLEALVGGLAHCRDLQELNLSRNPAITVRGWRALAALLTDPNSSLQELRLQDNDTNDESATMFANALAHNSTLTALYLDSDVESTGEALKAFAKVLCDASSVNSTFLSNHTLRYLSLPFGLPFGIDSSLSMNREDDEKRGVFRKILLNHGGFDMQPLFEWDLKVLPIAVQWLERAAAYGIEYEAYNRNRKLSAIYQFIRGMPELAVKGITGVNQKTATKAGGKRLHSVAFHG